MTPPPPLWPINNSFICGIELIRRRRAIWELAKNGERPIQKMGMRIWMESAGDLREEGNGCFPSF
jgi:hypothetical protein